MTDEIVGGFRLDRVLGRGTMGTVHLAHSVRGIDRLVAVKRIAPHGTADDRDRLYREAVTMSRLDHPHIVRILDVVDDQDGIAIVMQYAPNGSLAGRLHETGPLPSEELVHVLAPLAEALASAHRQGILHRDVKPSNILFTSDGHALLSDFGIADDVHASALAGSETALGTAAYLDPEVVDGAPPSTSSDVYALGVVGYEALVGLPPFRGPTPSSVLRAAGIGVYDELDATMIGPLACIVAQAMARRPADRFESAGMFAATLRSAVATGHAVNLGRVVDHSDSDDTAPRLPDATRHVDQRNPVAAGSAAAPATASPAPALSAAPRARALIPDPAVIVAIERVRATNQTVPILPGTTSFVRPLGGRPTVGGATTLNDARRRRKRLLAVATSIAVAVTCSIAFAGWRVSHADPQEGARVFRAVACDRASALCVSEVVKIPGGLRVTFANQAEPVDYRVGNDDDALRVSNFFCGSTATLALYRPSTGVVYYFKEWPRQVVGAPPVPVLADRTGIRDANVIAADHNSDRCNDVALTANGTRTWFTPNRQPLRLENVTPDPVPGSNSGSNGAPILAPAHPV